MPDYTKKGKNMIRYIYPIKIKEAKNVVSVDSLFRKKELQIGLNESDIAKFQPNSVIVLDFGKEIRGGVRILTYETQDAKCVRIRIRFGESLSECFAELGKKNATNDHSPRDIEADLSAWSDLCFGDTGFRFVRIDLLSDGWFCVKSIVAKSYELNKQPIYSYMGNDKLVSSVFDVAKRTIDLCSVGQYVYDGIKRDRLVWVGDMYPEMLALTTLYGSFPALERSLNFAKKQYPLPQFMYNMPTYSLWWILLVCDYYDQTSKKEFLSDKLDYMFGLLKLLDGRIGVDGKLDLNNYFVDWPSVGSVDEYIGAVFIAIAAYKKGIALLSKFGFDVGSFEVSLAALCQNDFAVRELKQVVGLKYFALGWISDEDYALLVRDGAQGFSTFMSWFILEAVAARDKELAVKLMKEYYGGMLAVGATTFFEDFDLKWLQNSSALDELPSQGQKDVHGDFGAHCYMGFRHSLCHGWSSGVIAFIKTHCC